MQFGFKVYDAADNTRLDVSDRITRVIYTRFLPYNESGSVTPPGFDGTKGDAFAVMISTANYAFGGNHRAPHQISISGNTVYWTRDPYYPDPNANSLLIVVHYK